MVGDPGGGDRGGVVVQVSGRRQAIGFDGHLAAPVGTQALEQRHGRLRPDGPAGLRMRRPHATKCTDSAAPLKLAPGSAGPRRAILRPILE